MIISANDLADGARLEADVCIVGSGAAGITLALSLSGQGLDILLVESGSVEADDSTQALYAGEVADERMHSPPDRYRQRRYGGSTTIWGGRCMPFDPQDFDVRPWVPYSGWPISYDEVARYYPAAARLAEIGHPEFDADTMRHGTPPPLFKGFRSDSLEQRSLERFSCPTNFGARYGRRLEVAPDVRVLMNANCVDVDVERDGEAVTGMSLATLAGKKLRVLTRRVVLAAGGLEVPRLLLNSRSSHAAGLGNRHDVVGRYYMCHMAGNTGRLSVDMPLADVHHGYFKSDDGVYCRRRLSLTAQEQRRLQVGNVVARLHFTAIADPRHRNGVLSGLYLAKNLISYEYGKRLNDGVNSGLKVGARHLMNIVADPVDTAGFLGHWIRHRTLARRKFPSVILRNKTNTFSLDVHGEQVPQPDSRVQLCGERDPLGMQRIRVDWRYHRDDIDTIARTLEVFASEFQRDGRLNLALDRERLEEDMTRFGAYGGHHIGTARMGADPRTSVVDVNSQVHGVAGLYVAGSATFPTSSQANPTLHIVAMALRLAEHLRQDLVPKRRPVQAEPVPSIQGAY
ncbi:MAG TPA: GMC family oxidoreductase [Roseateles sp.]